MDSDFEDYMVIYSCQEYATFTKDGDQLTDEQAWERRKSTNRNHYDDDREMKVEYYDDVEVHPMHSETISIHWRQPKIADGRTIFDATKIAPAKLAVAMAKAESMVPSIDKDTLAI